MSRAGAKASREVHARAALEHLIATDGLAVASRRAFEEDEARRVRRSEDALRRLAERDLGLTSLSPPYVLEQHADRWSASYRVCADVSDELTLNYYPGDKSRPESLYVYLGPCAYCGGPLSLAVASLADLGRALYDDLYAHMRGPTGMHSSCHDKEREREP